MCCTTIWRTRVLHWKVHLLQQFAIALVAAKAIHMRIDLQAAQAGVTLFVGTVQPLKGLIGLAAISVYLSDLISHVCLVVRDELGQSGIRIADTTKGVVSQGFARESPNLRWLLFHFSQCFQRAAPREEDLAASEMIVCLLRI